MRPTRRLGLSTILAAAFAALPAAGDDIGDLKPDQAPSAAAGAGVIAPNPSCVKRQFPAGGACSYDSKKRLCHDAASCEKVCCCAFSYDHDKWSGTYDWATTNVSAPLDIEGTMRPDSADLIDLGDELSAMRVLVNFRRKIATRAVAEGLRRLDAILDAAPERQEHRFTVDVTNCYRRAIGNNVRPLSPNGPDANAEAVCGLLFRLMRYEDMPERSQKQQVLLESLRQGAPTAFLMAWPGYTPHAEGVACDLILRDEKGKACFDASAGPGTGSPKCAIEQRKAVNLLSDAVTRSGGYRLDYEAWHFEWGGRNGKGSCRCSGEGCDNIWPVSSKAGCPD